MPDLQTCLVIATVALLFGSVGSNVALTVIIRRVYIELSRIRVVTENARAADEAARQVDARYDTFLEIVRTNRELLTIGLSNPEALSRFAVGGAPDDAGEEAAQRYAQMWVNFMHWQWYAHSTGRMDPIIWDRLKPDLLATFDSPLVRARWNRYKRYYSAEFIAFVETNHQSKV